MMVIRPSQGTATAARMVQTTSRQRTTGWRKITTARLPRPMTTSPAAAARTSQLQAKISHGMSPLLSTGPGLRCLPSPRLRDQSFQLLQLGLAGILRLEQAQDDLVERPVE